MQYNPAADQKMQGSKNVGKTTERGMPECALRMNTN